MDAQSGGHFLAGREGAAGFPELASPVESLGPEVDELRALAHRLQAENHQFRQQAGYRSSRHRNNLKRINTLERKVCGHCGQGHARGTNRPPSHGRAPVGFVTQPLSTGVVGAFA